MFPSPSYLYFLSLGLKHVPKDQMTHKNPNLRTQTGPVHTGPKHFSSPKTEATAAPSRKLPPVLELDGKKWKVVRYWSLSSRLHWYTII